MSRRAATTTTSTCGVEPSSAGTPPTTWCSSTAWSSGIGICSCAWKRTAASISFGSSIAGSRTVRTTTRWLPTPRRTRLESLCEPKSRLERGGEAVGVDDLALVEGAGRQGLDRRGLHLGRAVRPLTSAAATLPASMSRPTIRARFFFLVSCSRMVGIAARPRALALLQSTERPQTFRPATTDF